MRSDEEGKEGFAGWHAGSLRDSEVVTKACEAKETGRVIPQSVTFES